MRLQDGSRQGCQNFTINPFSDPRWLVRAGAKQPVDDRLDTCIYLGTYLLSLRATQGGVCRTGNIPRLYYVVPFLINNVLGWPLLVAFFALYPNGVFVPGWMRYIALYGFAFSLAWASSPQAFATPSGWLSGFALVSVVFIFSSSLYAQLYSPVSWR